MMSHHFTSMFEQLGNFTKNNLQNSKLVKEKNTNHVASQPSPHKQPPPPPLKKPCKLRNVASKAESYDTLYGNSTLFSHVTPRRMASFALDMLRYCEPVASKARRKISMEYV
ncbi:unnamed protein product [Diatraea saccharalis]|uniref:Uncharacterized protein n=1 Tax=Diatraea saccharalis TaxID=40085 RepID=A0A9N9W5B7_9NEOP|nr:unnamed protein product [Diatraea saccharalis]